MKLLLLNTTILAAGDLTETADAIQSVDAIYPKHVIPGWQIVDAPVPNGFTPAGYTWAGGQVVAKPPVVAPIPVPQSVSPLQAMLAIDAFGLAPAYEAWAADPARTFAQKAFIQRASQWRRDDPLLLTGMTELGLTPEQCDALFIAAAQF